jgi:hypothetical protein
MDEVHKHDSFKCNTPASEPFRIEMYWVKNKNDPCSHSCALNGADEQLLAGVL